MSYSVIWDSCVAKESSRSMEDTVSGVEMVFLVNENRFERGKVAEWQIDVNNVPTARNSQVNTQITTLEPPLYTISEPLLTTQNTACRIPKYLSSF